MSIADAIDSQPPYQPAPVQVAKPAPRLSAHQIHMMRHALGLEGASAKDRKTWEVRGLTHRNHYAASDEDAIGWRELVVLGLAFERNSALCDGPLFHVTEAGKSWLKDACR